MRRGLRRAWLPVVAAWGLLAGCEHNRASHYPPDPLLLSKKPVESRGDPDPSPAVARHEPPAPERLVATLGTPEAQDGKAVPAALRSQDDDGR